MFFARGIQKGGTHIDASTNTHPHTHAHTHKRAPHTWTPNAWRPNGLPRGDEAGHVLHNDGLAAKHTRTRTHPLLESMEIISARVHGDNL